jgi:hypothetical protein
LGWGETTNAHHRTIYFLDLFKEQSRYFLHHSNSESFDLEFQMIQVYCEVVYDE